MRPISCIYRYLNAILILIACIINLRITFNQQFYVEGIKQLVISSGYLHLHNNRLINNSQVSDVLCAVYFP